MHCPPQCSLQDVLSSKKVAAFCKCAILLNATVLLTVCCCPLQFRYAPQYVAVLRCTRQYVAVLCNGAVLSNLLLYSAMPLYSAIWLSSAVALYSAIYSCPLQWRYTPQYVAFLWNAAVLRSIQYCCPLQCRRTPQYVAVLCNGAVLHNVLLSSAMSPYSAICCCMSSAMALYRNILLSSAMPLYIAIFCNAAVLRNMMLSSAMALRNLAVLRNWRCPLSSVSSLIGPPTPSSG